MSFATKVVLVTGASSGVGAAIAQHFSQLSAGLVVTGRNQERLEQVAEKCKKISGNEPLVFVGDVTKQEDNERLIEATKERFGKLDVLVNNAGFLLLDSISNTKTMDTFDTMINVNLRSVVHLTSLALPLLCEAQGSIVNISSITVPRVCAGFMSYAMAKAGVDAFTKYCAVELAPKKVNVNSIILGLSSSELFDKAGVPFAKVEEQYLPKIPLGRHIKGDEVAALVAHLSCESSKPITGSHVAFDGGFLIA